MDCLEFRRGLGSDPRGIDATAREHLETCTRCAGAYAHAQAAEARLADALAVPVPQGLADRVLLAQLTGTRQQARVQRRRYAWIAFAAAACLALVIGVADLRYASASLPDLVAAHVSGPEERAAWQQRTPLPATRVLHAFADRGVHLVSVPANIAFVRECPIGRYRSVHMVMPENGAPVSVVYVVDHRVAADGDFRRDGLHGREVTIAHGTLVMLAANADRFDALEHSWRDAIEGPARIAAGSR